MSVEVNGHTCSQGETVDLPCLYCIYLRSQEGLQKKYGSNYRVDLDV